MSSKDIAPIVFSINIGNNTTEKQVCFSIDFTNIFKTQYRNKFIEDLKKSDEYTGISFYEFEVSDSWKNNWIIKKLYRLEEFSEKVPQDYIELNTLIYDIGKIIKRYSNLKYFNSDVSFF
jgi:hypothetical protein